RRAGGGVRLQRPNRAPRRWAPGCGAFLRDGHPPRQRRGPHCGRVRWRGQRDRADLAVHSLTDEPGRARRRIATLASFHDRRLSRELVPGANKMNTRRPLLALCVLALSYLAACGQSSGAANLTIPQDEKLYVFDGSSGADLRLLAFHPGGGALLTLPGGV